MRKETIVKFEKEFIAWCKGESVLKGAPISMSNRELYWETVKEFTDWKALDTVYVLNDSYSIYRKALAEGKTVQWSSSDNQYNHPIWETVTNIDTYFPISRYRIKPEEPQFKVGDWVRDIITNKIHQVKNEDICNGKYSQVIKWKPQPGE